MVGGREEDMGIRTNSNLSLPPNRREVILCATMDRTTVSRICPRIVRPWGWKERDATVVPPFCSTHAKKPSTSFDLSATKRLTENLWGSLERRVPAYIGHVFPNAYMNLPISRSIPSNTRTKRKEEAKERDMSDQDNPSFKR